MKTKSRTEKPKAVKDNRREWKNLSEQDKTYFRTMVHIRFPEAWWWLQEIKNHPFKQSLLEEFKKEGEQKKEKKEEARRAIQEKDRKERERWLSLIDGKKDRVEEKEEIKEVKEVKPKPKGGVIQCIIGLLEKASSKKPIKREEILEHLKKEFPDRQETAMKSTIASQVPGALLVEKKIVVSGTKEKGFWIETKSKKS